jgi:fatty acid desaturase
VSLLKFSIVPLFYLPLLITATLAGGWYPLLNYLLVFFSYLLLDRYTDSSAPAKSLNSGWVLDGLMYLHVLLSILAIFTLLICASDYLSTVISWLSNKLHLDLLEVQASSYFSQLSAAAFMGFVLSTNMVVGHELTHRTLSRLDMAFGNLSLAVVGDSQFSISHVHCHHKNIATADDAASARRGESIYDFIVRSTIGQYRESFQFEKARLMKRGHSALHWSNKLYPGVILTCLFMGGALFLAGWFGALLFLIVIFFSKMTYESTNYIQHYGLVRIPGSRVRPEHSWDCHSSFSSAALLNLTRHSDHHAYPNKAYWKLESTGSELTIDNGYIVQIIKAFRPSYWFKYMEPKLLYWEQHLASCEEKEIIKLQRLKMENK